MPSCRSVWQKPQNFWTTSLMIGDLSGGDDVCRETQRARIVADSRAGMKRFDIGLQKEIETSNRCFSPSLPVPAKQNEEQEIHSLKDPAARRFSASHRRSRTSTHPPQANAASIRSRPKPYDSPPRAWSYC